MKFNTANGSIFFQKNAATGASYADATLATVHAFGKRLLDEFGLLLGLPGDVRVTCAQTDHKPVEPSVGFRFEHDGVSVVAAGDTVPCPGLDSLCDGADALVHTVIRKDIIANLPMQRIKDTLDYHSSPEEAAQTASRGGVGTLVLTHYVPPIPTGGSGDDWKALTIDHFTGVVELGDDLHRIEIVQADGHTDSKEA